VIVARPISRDQRAYERAQARPCEELDLLARRIDATRQGVLGRLRERANRLALAMPQAERAVALIESVRAPARLCDLVVANLPCPVEDKARYAAEPTLGNRLRAAIALCEAQIAIAPH
jgi:hypothetical protein